MSQRGVPPPSAKSAKCRGACCHRAPPFPLDKIDKIDEMLRCLGRLSSTAVSEARLGHIADAANGARRPDALSPQADQLHPALGAFLVNLWVASANRSGEYGTIVPQEAPLASMLVGWEKAATDDPAAPETRAIFFVLAVRFLGIRPAPGIRCHRLPAQPTVQN